MRFLPQVERPDQPVSLHDKYFYTAASVFIFMAASQLPLYGFKPGMGIDPFYWVGMAFASNWGTLTTFGILPVFVPEFLVPVCISRILKVSSRTPEGRMLLDGAHKVVGICTNIVMVIIFMLVYAILVKVDTCTAVVMMLQLFFSGVVVLYLDEVLKKGYGLLPSISLFTATNICVSVLWKAFSPSYVTYYHEQGAQFEGAVIAWVHLLVTGTDKFSATCQAFCRQNLPNVTNLLVTCLFCLIALFFQSFYVALPVKLLDCAQFTYRLKFSYISYAAIILQQVVVTYLLVISEVLYVIFCALVDLHGRSNGSSKTIGICRRGDGIFYYLTAPPTLIDLQRDPVHVFLYIVIVLSACAYFSVIWTRCCMTSRRFLHDMLGEDVQLPGPDTMSDDEFQSCIAKGACLGGICVGLLIVLSDFAGLCGSGMGILLAVAAVYPYFEGVRAEDIGVFGL